LGEGANDRMRVGKTFDRRNLMTGGVLERHLAGAHGLAAEMHSAGSAFADAAAIFGSGQSGKVADRPKQGHARVGVDWMLFAVDIQRGHMRLS
jgi:hypothetical protein